jgi:aminoglycoside phosphotransferase (APT) family kinase protein
VDASVTEQLAAALEPWLAACRGRDSAIVELRRIATGNSRANWYVELADGTRLVARIEQGGVFGSSTVDEFRFMQAAYELGCPVARVRWIEATGEVAGQPMFVMDFLDGATAGRDDRTMSPELADDFVGRLHALHTTDWLGRLDDGVTADITAGVTAEVTAETATHRQIDRWYGVYRSATEVAIPLLEEGAAWLHHHAPVCDRPAIVHGDPGPGNFVHDGSRVIAFTDWEFAHLGDPAEDWAYLVTMRGARTMPAADWLARFRRVAGVSISPVDLHYWSVFNFFKGACANLTCRAVFATVNPAPNMAIIGTALHQTYVRQVAALVEHDQGGRDDDG